MIYNVFHLRLWLFHQQLILVFIISLFLSYLFFNILESTSMAQSQPQIQIIQSKGRNNSMPTWRGYMPIRTEPTTSDQYSIAPQFSQKVFLGGIPSELTEGTAIHYFI